MVEQVTFAALDTKSLDYACMLVAQVKKQFPGTQRAERLTVRLLFPYLPFGHDLNAGALLLMDNVLYRGCLT